MVAFANESEMRFALCDAVARCQARRLRETVAVAPLPAAIVVILVVLAPIALVRVGRAIGSELAGAVDTGGVADALVVGPLLAAAVAGAALAVSLPGRPALGQQVAAGPCTHLAAIASGLLVPGLIGALAVLPSLVAVSVALAHELPGGAAAGAALVLATVAGVPAGAVLAEGGLAAARGRPARSLAVGGGVIAWAATSAGFPTTTPGAAVLGPVAPVGAALRGTGSAWPALAAASGAAVALALAWIALAATRPEKRWRVRGPSRNLVRGGRRAIPSAVAVLLARRDDVRLAAVAAMGFGVAGTTIATSAAAPQPTPFLLATTTTLLGSILCPLVLCGVLLHGRWLWVGGPRDRRLVTLAACLVGLVASALPVVVVGALATAVSGASLSALGVVAAFVLVGSAAALLAGALVPWNGEGVGDQLTTFAALAAVAIATSLGVGVAGPRLVSLGVPAAAVVVVVCGFSAVGALGAVGRRLGGTA
jgi:hypothetical protein